MPGTFGWNSLYPNKGGPSVDDKVNAKLSGPSTPSAVTPGGKTTSNWNVPVLSGVASGFGLSLPTLLALGAIAWFLFHEYD